MSVNESIVRGAFAALLLAHSGCGSTSSGAGGGCPVTAPSSCQSPVPSWTTDIQPILRRSCSPCHFPGGAAVPPYDYSTYSGVVVQRMLMSLRVSTCQMPLAPAPPLPVVDGDRLLDWLECGAPEN